jgi:signal transduction histidine kinase/CheY-like chemotaxis protein
MHCVWIDARGTQSCALAVDDLNPTLGDIVSGVHASGKREYRAGEHPSLPLVPFAESALLAPRLELTSVLVLPLVARGRTLGVVAIGGIGGRAYQAGDFWLSEELSARAATALDNALLVRDIQEADRRKNEFLAMLAHELRNPLAPVRNAVHFLKLQGPQQPEFAWARDVIDRQVTNLVRMVDDLLDVSRITRGKIQLFPETLDVTALVTRAVETSRPLVETHRHSLKVSLPSLPLQVHGDATRLSQVLSNLLNNAAKYTPDGGRIEFAVTREGREAVFRVRDNGPGIPREMLAKIFDLFTQVDDSLDRSHGGLGIGLTLVRRLVEMHEGSVEAHSEGDGKGSEFVVRLPVREMQQALTNDDDSIDLGTLPPARLRILVVDDNVDAADSLAMVLRLHGHDVQLVHDGYAALDAAATFAPQVVLLDIGLPGINGYEVARKLRGSENGQRPLLVAISGYGQEEDRQRSFEVGFDHHLIKPVSPATLEKLLSGIGEAERSGRRLSVSCN